MKINEIKNDSRIKLSGNYLKCASSSLFYFIIFTLLKYFQHKSTYNITNSILLSIINAIFLLIDWILSYGIIANIIALVDIKTNSITDFINSSIKNFSKYTKIGLKILLKEFVPIILFLLSAFYWIGTNIAKINALNFLCFNKDFLPLASIIWIISSIYLLFIILNYVLVAYIYYDNPNMSVNEIIGNSKKLIKNNKFNYILLILSFFHWFLLTALLLLILNKFIDIKYLLPFIVFFYSLIRPYIIISKNQFYKELKEISEIENESKKEA